ncbi:MoaD/ThiS family protein [Angustibacter aerolatus]
MAEVTVRFWAAARAAAGTDRCTEQADSTAVLVERLQTRGPELTAVLARSSLLVDGLAARGDVPLHDGQVVEVLPPFAGG